MRSKITNFILGFIFIIIGVGLVGNAYGWWYFNIFFDGWWTLFIIIPCALSIIRHGFNVGSIIGLGIGVVFLLSAQDIFDFDNVWKLVLPAIFVAIGLSIIFKGSFNRQFYSEVKILSEKGGMPEINAIFSGQTPNFNNMPFTGCNANAIFGGVELNLRNAIISEDCVINASAIFGGVDIYLPYNVNAKINCTPIFGGVDSKAVPCTDPNAPTVYINATCIFGGVDVK